MERTPPRINPQELQAAMESDPDKALTGDPSIKFPSSKLAALTRQRNIIENLITDSSEVPEVDVIEDLLGVYQEKYNNLLDSYQSLKRNENLTESDHNKLDQWFKSHNESYIKFNLRANNWITTKTAIQPSDSVSNIGDKSQVSISSLNSSIIRQKIIEKKAKIEAEKCYFGETENLMKKLRMIQNERDNHELRKKDEELLRQREELRKKQQLQKEEDDCMCQLKNIQLKKDEKEHNIMQSSDLNMESVFPVNSAQPSGLLQVMQKQNEISLLLAQTFQKASLPERQLQIFDGKDLTKYQAFSRNFDRMIALKCTDDIERMVYLEQYTSHEPKKLVQSCGHMDPSVGYKRAQQLLELEYGNQYVIAEAYLEKLDKFDKITNEDKEQLNELSVFLMGCANYMENMSSLNHLNSPKEIMGIVMKLPYKMREAWRRKTYHLMKNCKQINFKHLVDYIYEETLVMKQPLFGNIKEVDYHKKFTSQKPIPNEKNTKRTFAMAAQERNFDTNVIRGTSFSNNHFASEKIIKGDENIECLCCKKRNHTLDSCFFFIAKPNSERFEFVKKAGLCFGCLKQDHSSKWCKDRLTCKTCAKKHPTCLHNNERISEKRTVTSLKIKCETGAGSKEISCPVVPIKLRIKGTQHFILTYAGLDSFSTDCFINEDLLKDLNASGKSLRINISTINHHSTENTQALFGLEAADIEENNIIDLPVVYTRNMWPFSKKDSPRPIEIETYPQFKEIPFTYINANIGIMIGMNCAQAIKPLKIINSTKNGPYASLHILGWAINGPLIGKEKRKFSFSTRITDKQDIENKLEKMFTLDFMKEKESEKGSSVEDDKWNQLVNNSIHKNDDEHYEMDLPFRNECVRFPDNKNQAYRSLIHQKWRLQKCKEYYSDYIAFMDMMLENNFIEQVPMDELEGQPGNIWFLTHHGVYHKRKRSIRIVFNCSKKFQNISLNDELLSGPDLTNNLLGILLRFREGKIGVISDIEKMYYQVKVTRKHRDFLRFYWYPENDLAKEPKQYRLTVHVFGAVSSPSCSNFALRQTAMDDENCTQEAKNTVLKSFYVDDMVKSFDNKENAIKTTNEVIKLVATGGFKLTKFISNSKELLETIPAYRLSEKLETKEILKEDVHQRALGVLWKIKEDNIGFKISIPIDNALTRRGILSSIFSIYDPYGYLIPALLPAKVIFQKTCNEKLDWDQLIPENIKKEWLKWLSNVHLMEKCSFPRFYGCDKEVKRREMHIFSDGSEQAYASVAYLRQIHDDNSVYCIFVFCKSRLTPLNNSTLKTIPRIELSGARLSVIISEILKSELNMEINSWNYWTDSTTVLKYIKNESKRFQRFVANKVNFIRSWTSPDDWHHVPGTQNVADYASRGLTASKFMQLDEWKYGPKFLWQENIQYQSPTDFHISPTDSELKVKTFATTIEKTDNYTRKFIESSSSFYKIKVKVAWMLHYIKWLKNKLIKPPENLDAQDLQLAEVQIWKYIQRLYYSPTLTMLEKQETLGKNNPLLKLNPFISDKDGLLRIGGRLRKSNLSFDSKHQIILPKSDHVTDLLIYQSHEIVGHMGKEMVLTHLRKKYWIIGANNAIKSTLRKCFQCRKRQGKPQCQLMADLPKERVLGEKPFMNTGTDLFGPFYVTQKRSTVKRYGVIFSCLATRAIHIEVAHSLETDSFIMALRRFMARRGTVKVIFSDNGTNFVGANKELRTAIKNWNKTTIEIWLKQHEIRWKFNPPFASHHGGVWEREIRSIRNVLNGIMNSQHIKLTDDSLNTLLCEVESILNNRPLTAISDDISDMEPLTPNHLLLVNDSISFPPDLFNHDDSQSKKRWRQVQYLADLFWTRWRKEYLPLLQTRQKWQKQQRSVIPGDLVLVIDQLLPRNQWCTGRVTETHTDSQGCARSVKLKTFKQKENSKNISGKLTEITRPITKLIILRTNEELILDN